VSVEAGLARALAVVRRAVAGERDELDPRLKRPHRTGELVPVHHRQADVEDRRIRAGVAEHREGIGTAVRDGDLEPARAQEVAHQHRRVGVIVDDEDAMPTARVSRTLPQRGDGRGRRRAVHAQRQLHDERAAVTCAAALRAHGATVTVHEAAHDRESESEATRCAIAALRHLDELIEDLLDVARIDAHAVVDDGDTYVSVLTLGADDDRGLRVRVLGRVRHEVREDLSEACGIAVDDETALRDLDGELAAPLFEEWPRHLDRTRDCRRQLERLLAQLDLAARDARDVEQVVDEPHHVLDLALEDILRARVDTLHAHHLQRGHDGREGVAELVSEHREELVLDACRTFRVAACTVECTREGVRALGALPLARQLAARDREA